MESSLGELINVALIMNDKVINNSWKPLDSDDLAPYMTMQEKNGEPPGTMEIETRDSTEKNAGSNEESDNEQQQPVLRNVNSLNSDPENPGDHLNTTNEI